MMDMVLNAGLNLTTLRARDMPDTELGVGRRPVFQRRSHRPTHRPATRAQSAPVISPPASFWAEGALLNWRSPPSVGSGLFEIAVPCARVPGRYAEASNFQNRVAHPWSWAIGSSTSAA
jgi:hypothetical protein